MFHGESSGRELRFAFQESDRLLQRIDIVQVIVRFIQKQPATIGITRGRSGAGLIHTIRKRTAARRRFDDGEIVTGILLLPLLHKLRAAVIGTGFENNDGRTERRFVR